MAAKGAEAAPESPAPPPAETPARELKPEGTISWRDAAKHYNKTMIVEGKIVLTNNIGKITFLNFDRDYRNTFTAVIKREDYQKFPGTPRSSSATRRSASPAPSGSSRTLRRSS